MQDFEENEFATDLEDCVVGRCNRGLGIIFLCGEGWVCEACFRELADVPPDISDASLVAMGLVDDDPQMVEWRVKAQEQLDGEPDPDISGIFDAQAG